MEHPVIGMQTTCARKTARPIGSGARFCLLPITWFGFGFGFGLGLRLG